MCCIDDDNINTRINQHHRPFETSVTNRGRRSNTKAAKLIFACCWVQNRFLCVFERQKTRQFAVSIGDQQFFDTALFHHVDGSVPINGFTQHSEVVEGHHFRDQRCLFGGKAHVAVRHNTDNVAFVVNNGETSEVIPLHQCLCIGERLVGA